MNLDNPDELQANKNKTPNKNDSGITLNENNSIVKRDTNETQLDGFSPHTISTPVNGNKFEAKVIKHQNTQSSSEQQKLDFKCTEDSGKMNTEKHTDNKQKTSAYDSLSNSIVDNLLNQLSQNAELCNSRKKDNRQETKLGICNKNDISDLVFEDCKKVIDEKDKGNVSKISPGQYYGQAKHKDGSMLSIVFEVGLIFCNIFK